ncbi:MAG TPA: MFS transporter [Thermomicrobiales bacterium]
MIDSPGSTPPRRAPFIALLTADGISGIGNVFTYLAIPWFVLQTTGSAGKTGVTAAVGALPVLVSGIVGGVVVDRLGFKRTSIVADLASAVNVALVPLLYHTVGLAFWELLVLVFLGAVLDAPGWAARLSLYPELARLGGVQLERANASSQMVTRVAGLVGPPLGGVLIAAFSPTNVMWIDAATFLVSAGIVALRVPARGRETDGATTDAGQGGRPGSLLDGLRFVRGDRLIRWMIAAFALGNLLAEPIYSVVLPVYAKEVFGSAVDLGFMYAALAAGSLIGNVLFLSFAPRLPRRTTIVTGFAVRALTFWVLIPLPPLVIVTASIVVNAIFLEPTNPIWMTILQERVPETMRGRVFGSLMALSSGARSVGIVAYGAMLEQFGLQETLIVLSAVNLAVPLVLWIAPPLRIVEWQRVAVASGP